MRATLLILTLCSAALTANAQTIGLQFDKIPVGSQFHYETDERSVYWIEIYKGKHSAYHELHSYWADRNFKPTKPFEIEYFNDAGLKIRSQKLSGSKPRFTFEPFDCARSTAPKCQHVQTTETTGKLPKVGREYFKKPRTWRRDFEARKTGRNLLVIRNADSNRLKRRYTFDDRGVITRMKNISDDLSKGHKLVREMKPQ